MGDEAERTQADHNKPQRSGSGGIKKRRVVRVGAMGGQGGLQRQGPMSVQDLKAVRKHCRGKKAEQGLSVGKELKNERRGKREGIPRCNSGGTRM